MFTAAALFTIAKEGQAARVSIDGRAGRPQAVYPDNGILCDAKKEASFETCHGVDGPGGQYAQ